MRIISVLTITALLTGAAGCADSNGGDDNGGTLPADSLTFIRLAPTAPPLCADSIGFWAFRGIGVDTALVFPESGNLADCNAGSTEEFLELKLDQASLKAYPDGTPFQVGDSVFISMAWVGNDSILFHLQPTGLVFDPAHPADLKIDYSETGGDLDSDNDVDSDDTQIEQQINIWRQPTLVDDYTKVGTATFEDLDEIEAKLNGFSRYALAY